MMGDGRHPLSPGRREEIREGGGGRGQRGRQGEAVTDEQQAWRGGDLTTVMGLVSVELGFEPWSLGTWHRVSVLPTHPGGWICD